MVCIKVKKSDVIEWTIFLIVMLIVWSHVNVVVSNSMFPVMKRGDFVIVENANLEFNPKDVNVGDIVVYNAHWPKFEHNQVVKEIIIDNKTLFIFKGDITEPVIHRVIEKIYINNNPYYIIKGDNNPTYDPELVSYKQIRQRVIVIDGHPLVIPYLGYISIYLKENVWILVIIIVILFAYDYFKKEREGKSNKNSKDSSNDNNKNNKNNSINSKNK